MESYSIVPEQCLMCDGDIQEKRCVRCKAYFGCEKGSGKPRDLRKTAKSFNYKFGTRQYKVIRTLFVKEPFRPFGK